MKRAVPPRCGNRASRPSARGWWREIGSFDRNVRRGNEQFRSRVFLIPVEMVKYILSDRTMPFDTLNALPEKRGD